MGIIGETAKRKKRWRMLQEMERVGKLRRPLMPMWVHSRILQEKIQDEDRRDLANLVYPLSGIRKALCDINKKKVDTDEVVIKLLTTIKMPKLVKQVKEAIKRSSEVGDPKPSQVDEYLIPFLKYLEKVYS